MKGLRESEKKWSTECSCNARRQSLFIVTVLNEFIDHFHPIISYQDTKRKGSLGKVIRVNWCLQRTEKEHFQVGRDTVAYSLFGHTLARKFAIFIPIRSKDPPGILLRGLSGSSTHYDWNNILDAD